MADVQVNVKVDAKEADESIKGLTRQLKQLREQQAKLPEGSAAWKKLGQDINDLEGRLGDLNDRFNTLRGSGVERLQSSFGLLREGLTSADFGKAKIALQGIGQAMSAIPVLLIVTGIMKLIENFDKLKNSSGLLGTAFKAIGTIIDTLTGAIADFTDWIGLTNIESEKLAETQINNAKKIQDAVTERYDAEIRLAKAAGKNTEDLEKQKVMAVRQALLEQIKLKAQAAVLDGELNEEELKNLDELRKALTESYIQEKEIDLKAKKEQTERNKKAAEEKKKINDEARREQAEAIAKEIDDDRKAKAKQLEDEKFAQEELLKLKNQQYADEQKIRNEWQKIADEENKKIEAEVEARRLKAEEDFKRSEAAKVEAQRVGLDAARGLSEAFFAFQLNAAQGNEQKEMEIRKRMFAVDKAFNVARAIQDGIRSVQAALTIPPPGGQILAGVNATLAAANVAKILATKFSPSGGGGNSSNVSAPRSNSTPNISTPTPPQAQLPNQQGTFINQQPVWVSVQDINKSQSRVARVEEQARF